MTFKKYTFADMFRLGAALGIIQLITACSPLFSETFPYSIEPSEDVVRQPLNIHILDSRGLKLTDGNGDEVTELSGIAWDNDDSCLYAISDEGMLYHLKVVIADNKIELVKVSKAYRLLARSGKKLKGKWKDSEGLSALKTNNGISGDAELVISFEHKPRVAKYSTEGKFLGEVRLPNKLWRKKSYRNKNKALESVAVHADYGVLTAAEYPLKKQPMKLQTIYSSRGKEWHFKASEAKNSAVTGLEILPNGNALVLERAWAGVKKPIVITLSEVNLHQCGGKKKCEVKELASLSSEDGWMLDNFEGLAHYKNNEYFMVSDDNESAFQSTVLVLFRLSSEKSLNE